MSTVHSEVVVATANDEAVHTNALVKDQYVETWLDHHPYQQHHHHQQHHLSDIPTQPSWDEATDDIQMHDFSLLAHHTSSFDSSQEHTYTHTHHAYYTDIHHSYHRRAVSLEDPDTPTTMSRYQPFLEPSEQPYQPYRELTRMDPSSSQLYHYRLQHSSYLGQRVHNPYLQSRRHSFIPISEEPYHPPPMKSATQLAWERHNYYQRLQNEEEQQALQMHHERLRQQQQYHVQDLSRQRQANQESLASSDGSCVARTGSLNRLSSPPLLSTETSRLLGLCRSNTISAAVKRLSLAKKDKESCGSGSRPSSRAASRPGSPSSVAEEDEDEIMTRNHSSLWHVDYSSNNSHNTTPSPPPPSSTTLSRKKTLKEHLTPSFRSLARHCSARFSQGRPLSFAGAKSDPIVEHDGSSGRRSLESRRIDHMSDFKQLRAGPETLRQSMYLEQKPVHRKVTLFRSMSTRAPSSTAPSMTRNAIESRNSLRLANGRGLDFLKGCEEKPTTTTTVHYQYDLQQLQQQLQQQQQQEQQQQPQPQEVRPVPTIGATEFVESIEADDDEETESMQKQISAILAMGRKDIRRRRSSGSRTSTPTPLLSPLALEAQEYPDTSSSNGDDESERSNNDDESVHENMAPFSDIPKTVMTMETGLKNPCEHIAFMLVPKSRYEFQPLVVQ